MSTPEPPAGEDPRLIDHAMRLAEHQAVDWERASVSGGGEGVHDTLERLRELESVAQAFRAAPRPEGFAWGPLRAIECLGRGASGEVWRAWDPALQRDVALKLRPTSGRSATRWLAEARRLARVRHPHVVAVHGADVHEGRAGLWMDLVRGRTLEQCLETFGPLGAREAAGIGVELCGALAAVHAAGLVHGDLKAANVLREGLPAGERDLGSGATGAGHVWLMDFGSAHEPSAVPSDSAHTPVYAAPEILAGGEPSVRGDIYALGVLLFRLVTARFPAEAETVAALREVLARGETRSLRSLRPDLPAAFVQAVERSLAIDPARRFAECGELERALGAATIERPERASARALDRWRAFAAGAALVAAAWGGLALWNAHPPGAALERPRPPYVVEVAERFAGGETDGQYGYATAIMDLFGDGNRELLVGAPGESLGGGRVHVLRRGADGAWAEDRVIGPFAAGDAFGFSIANVGDVNGDGWPDLAVGALHHSAQGRASVGSVSVFFGGPRFHGVPDLVLEGPRAGDGFGYSIAGLGDVNGDGIADFAVGAPGDDRAGANAGLVYVYHGGRPPSGRAAMELEPPAPGGQFGISVASAGDFNGDGVPDLAVGANWHLDRGEPRGRVMVYFGGRAMHARPDWSADGPDPAGWFGIVAGAGDLNGDGYDDLVVGAGRARGSTRASGAAYVYFGGAHAKTDPALVLPGNQTGDGFGYAVAAPGDLDGDGWPDLVVSASGSDASAPGAGAVKVYRGGPGMDAKPDVVITGDAAGDAFGTTVAAAGDLDGDGLADLLVGSCWASPRIRGGGEAWLVRFAPHAWVRPRAGERLRAGGPVELRWRGRIPADLAVRDRSGRWLTLAHGAGGADENALSVRLPEGLRDSVRFRLTPAGAHAHGRTLGPALALLPR